MTLLNAPTYNAGRERLKAGLLISGGLLVLLLALTRVGGFLLGHGWFFTNLYAEHRVGKFFQSLQDKNYDRAYAIWMNDADWKQHPQKFDYSEKRFQEDWIIVAVRVNGDHKAFMWYQKSDGTLTYPAPHQLQYGSDN